MPDEPEDDRSDYFCGAETDFVSVDGEEKTRPMKSHTKSLTSLMAPDDLKTPEQRKAYGDSLTDEIVELVQAERKRLGLPPLT